MGLKTADSKENFKLATILFYSRLSIPSGILHDRRHMQFANSARKQKGGRLPFAKAPKVI
jgi:hypothetical protein